MVGCRNAMHFRYPEELDYIEIFNCGSEGPISGNMDALAWWEKLVLNGYRIAAVSGIDLHSLPRRENVFTTYAETGRNPSEGKAECVIDAIMRQKTFISKGPLVSTRYEDGMLHIDVDHSSGYLEWSKQKAAQVTLMALVRQDTGDEWRGVIPENKSVSVPVHVDAAHFCIRLYAGSFEDSDLVAAGLSCHRDGGC